MPKEADITNPLRVAASRLGARLFRQNTGLGWVGRIVSKTDRTVTLADPRPLHAGLCVGSSDVIGWTPVTVTPDMVGQTLAVFTAIEVKTKGVAVTKEQRAFVEAVASAGGIGAVAFSTEEGLAALERKSPLRG